MSGGGSGGGSTAASEGSSSSSSSSSSASGGGGSEDACRDYQSSLEDLTFNSKPHINMLTILAEENVPFAKDIVSLIEAQIAKAPSNEKLPVMYLMDSIVKNVGREYLDAFTKNLVATFVNVFEKVDENTRKSLFKLRSTWDEIFPLKKLYALDVRVNSVDPAWPIKPLPPNVNTSSIHVNPKFLNKSPEEPPAPSTTVCSPVSCAAVPSAPVVPEMQKNLTQEQIIRQQLLAKQKQLLELQQKKLELELEQTKAQLAVSLSVQQSGSSLGQASLKPHVPPPPHMPLKASHQVCLPPEKKRLSPLHDVKAGNRDPRLNRSSQHSHSKDQSHRKDFVVNPASQPDPKPSKNLQAEKQNVSKQEKQKQSEKLQKKEFDHFDAKSKSKSPSPLQTKLLHAKDTRNQECENTRVTEISKRDPRLKKHLLEKPEGKDEDIKEKRRSVERKDKEEHRSVGGRNKIINGVVQKQDTNTEESEKPGGKPGRSSTRKRSRSPRSRSPSSHSPKRRERRSPKRRLRSLSPSGPKTGKPRQSGPKQSHIEDFGPGIRDERSSNKRSLKQEVRDSRRLKKTHEDRTQDGMNQHPSKASLEPKENVENWQGSKSSKRWKSGWEENKNPQLNEEHQGPCKSPHQRHRDTWATSKGVPSPRTPKQQHRLSVDANLQIPKELTLANKGELLKKASDRLASGEITQDDFLVLVHQIRQLFQYQEGKHRCNVWDSPTGEKGISKKKPLLSESELIYHEHKATLRRTQVQRSFPRHNLMDAEEILDYHLNDAFLSGKDCEQTKKCAGQFGERSKRHSPVGGSRPYSDNSAHDGRRRHEEPNSSKGIREEQRSPFSDHYKRSRYEDTEKQFTDGPGSRFGVTDGKQRFSSLMEERSHFEGSPRHPGARAGGDGQTTHFEGPANTNSRIEGPQAQSNLRFEGSLGQPTSQFDGPPGQSGGKGSLLFDGPPAQMGGGSLRFEGPSGQVGAGTAIRFEGPMGQPGGALRFDGPAGQSMAIMRFEGTHGQPSGGMRFEGPHGHPSSGIRFDGPHGKPSAGMRFEGPHDQPSGNLRFDGQPSGAMRFEGPHGQPSSGIRLEGPLDRSVGPHGPPGGGMRFEGPHGQPMGPHGQPGSGLRFEGPHLQPMGPLGQPGGNLRFEAPHGQPMGAHGQPASGLRFEGPHGQPMGSHGQPGVGPRFDGPHSQPVGPLGQPGIGPRFEGPSVQSGGGMRFEGSINQAGPRFDGSQSRFDGQPSHLQRLDGLHVQPGPRCEMGPAQQTPPRFEGPPGQVQPRFDTSMPQRFDDPQHQQTARFDIPLGPRIENVANHPASRLETPPYGQTGPYNEPPNQPPYNGPSQGMQFQRPEQIFDNPQGPSFNGPPVSGAQAFANTLNRAPGPPFYDDKNLQGPQYGNFSSMTLGNVQPPQQGPVMSIASGQPVSYIQGQPLLPVHARNPGSFVQSQPGNVPLSYPDNHLGQLDVNELYSKLLSTGILKVLQPDSTPALNEVSTQPTPEEEEEDQDQNEDQDVPDLTNFVIEELKQRYDSVINRLYTGIQCYSCGMRFTTSQTDVYADHLDWHYRQNRTEKDVSRKVTHRRWYYSLTDWIEFEEIADLEERAKSQFFEKVHEEVVLKTQEAAKEKEFQSVPAGPAGVDESCEICQEQFEQYWDEEEEEWHLKNAIRVDEKIYHPSCYEDYQKTSSFDSTPSPSKTPAENPLNIMLSIVKQEVQDSCNSPKIKEEPEEKPEECMEGGLPASVEIKTEPEKVESA
ncbi:pre-mRNA cleavage complex 2 protein Pcf11 isoform X2 [Varanus komodoensis]|uniref:pre-mRNA cleavage complex 2 protein Pcf11 isoform X2 n=1 Tax=Varanus komodoensis TaxID=61221 RepID=UPI001CF7BA44|nr:pre-mRNA cleavage complex 2 protein Pcf11 isoform X2 [Varanus komodoensis]